jgi:hypothetical protein
MIFVQQKIRELTNVATENFIPQQKITFTVSYKDYFHCSEQFYKCTIIFVQQNFRELTTTEVFNPCHRGNTWVYILLPTNMSKADQKLKASYQALQYQLSNNSSSAVHWMIQTHVKIVHELLLHTGVSVSRSTFTHANGVSEVNQAILIWKPSKT